VRIIVSPSFDCGVWGDKRTLSRPYLSAGIWICPPHFVQVERFEASASRHTLRLRVELAHALIFNAETQSTLRRREELSKPGSHLHFSSLNIDARDFNRVRQQMRRTPAIRLVDKISRREFCALASVAATVPLGSSCSSLTATNDGRLSVRPKGAVNVSTTGQVKLGLDSERDAILQLPDGDKNRALPLLVMLHGAGQNADEMFEYLGSSYQEPGVVVLAPNSRDYTWDALHGGFGEDIEFLNRALSRTFETVTIDPARLAVGGFSDGATYALSLGLINGDLFPRVVAFSPGFVVDGTPNGKPKFFVSHGTRDHILPIDSCSRRIVASLKQRGYEVTFREFNGDHEIPEDVASDGMNWLARK
jgi:phospholipase/carboxylesterase